MNKEIVRFDLLEIRNPPIYTEVSQKRQQGLTMRDIMNDLLLELVYLRQMVELCQSGIRTQSIPQIPAGISTHDVAVSVMESLVE